jgi:hypothetical protein
MVSEVASVGLAVGTLALVVVGLTLMWAPVVKLAINQRRNRNGGQARG